MASIEEYVELLLPIQQEKVAMAALRGVSWERIVVKEGTFVPGAGGSAGYYATAPRTKYAGYLPPESSWFGDFDDVYECAVRGLMLLELRDAPPPPDETHGPDAPFALAPGNEQPTLEHKTFRWPGTGAFGRYRGGNP